MVLLPFCSSLPPEDAITMNANATPIRHTSRIAIEILTHFDIFLIISSADLFTLIV